MAVWWILRPSRLGVSQSVGAVLCLNVACAITRRICYPAYTIIIDTLSSARTKLAVTSVNGGVNSATTSSRITYRSLLVDCRTQPHIFLAFQLKNCFLRPSTDIYLYLSFLSLISHVFVKLLSAKKRLIQ